MGGDENRPGQGSSKERHAQRAREPDEGGGQPGVTWSAAATSAKGVSRLGADPGEEGRLGRCFPDLHSPEHQGLLGKSLALTLPYCPEPTQLIKVCLPDKHIHTHTHTYTQHTRACQRAPALGSAACPLSALRPPSTTGCPLSSLTPLKDTRASPRRSQAPVCLRSCPSSGLRLPSCAFLASVKRHHVVLRQPTRDQHRASSHLLHILHHPVASNPHQMQAPCGLLCLFPRGLSRAKKRGCHTDAIQNVY